jgi:hypothetical protein
MYLILFLTLINDGSSLHQTVQYVESESHHSRLPETYSETHNRCMYGFRRICESSSKLSHSIVTQYFLMRKFTKDLYIHASNINIEL